jgi:hypothetical protein
MESEEYYKDITEIEISAGVTKGIKPSNDSASLSPLLCTKEVVE